MTGAYQLFVLDNNEEFFQNVVSNFEVPEVCKREIWYSSIPVLILSAFLEELSSWMCDFISHSEGRK